MQAIIFNTSGAGYWSGTKMAVHITDMQLRDVTADGGFAELCVYFGPSWDTAALGLIYTDPQWLTELRAFLTQHGLPGHDVEYSEQGMQGDDYVSLDVGGEFIAAWQAKFPG
jgi:hypothetical protein